MNFYIILAVISIIICVLLVLIILVQNSKGGGLASNFSSSNQYMGVRKTADFLEKTTWTLAILLMVISMASIFTVPKTSEQSRAQEIQRIGEENPENLQEPGIQPPPQGMGLPNPGEN